MNNYEQQRLSHLRSEISEDMGGCVLMTFGGTTVYSSHEPEMIEERSSEQESEDISLLLF